MNQPKGQNIFSVVEILTMQAMKDAADNHGGSAIEALFAGISAVAGALRPVAAMVGFTPNDRNNVTDAEANAATNNTSLLVAALLTAKVADWEADSGETKMDYGPHQLFKAIDAAQRVLGHDPRSKLSKPLVSAADEHKTPEYLGNSWHVHNTPGVDEKRPHFLN